MTRRTAPTEAANPAKDRQEVVNGLQSVRLLVREIGGNYLAALQVEIARVAKLVEAAPPELTKEQRKDLRAMGRAIQSLEVEPAKGRRRDLKALARLVSKLVKIVDEW